MKRTKNKSVNVRKQLKIKLENTATRYKNCVGFRPTQEQAYHWFRVINRGLFNGRLPITPIHLIRIGDGVLQIGIIEKHQKENLIKRLYLIMLM
jgi:hypothetical protein